MDKSLRTVQRYLMDYREGDSGDPKKPKKKDKPYKVTSAQARALVAAQLAANELVAAWEHGGDVASAVRDYKKVAVSPKELDSYSANMGVEHDWKLVTANLIHELEKNSLVTPAIQHLVEVIKKALGAPTPQPTPEGDEETQDSDDDDQESDAGGDDFNSQACDDLPAALAAVPPIRESHIDLPDGHVFTPDKYRPPEIPDPSSTPAVSLPEPEDTRDEAEPATEAVDASLELPAPVPPSPFNIVPPDDGPDEESDIESSVAIKNCSYIYGPAGQAGEYAPLASNPYRGCGHKCAYCYVPAVLRMSRAEFDAGAIPRANFLAHLLRDAKKYQAAGIHEQVMLSFTTDVYNVTDTSLTRPTIEILIEHGLGFCVLTKGGARALADIDLYRLDRDAFASTLTSLDDAFSLKWERAAALPGDRIATLKAFHGAGIFTWVSLEPVLDTNASLAIVQRTHEFVDLYKVGRVNYLPMTKTTDWKSYTERMIELLTRLGRAHYIKHDLQPYLPTGYRNPMRAQQHH